MPRSYLFGGNDQSVRMNEIHILDTHSMRWSRCAATGETPIPRSAHSCCMVNGTRESLAACIVRSRDFLNVLTFVWPVPDMYVFGGWDGQEELGDLHCFDTTTNIWTRVETSGTPPAPRHFHNACRMGNDRLYVFGGYDGESWRNDVVVLDLTSMTWTQVVCEGEKPGVRASGSACVLDDDRMLVFGGYDGTDFLDDLWVLHTQRDPSLPHRWEKIKPPLPAKRKGDKATWPQARSGHSQEVVGNLVLFFGGRYRSGRFNDVNVLDTESMTWHKPAPSGSEPQPRKTHSTARVGDRIFLFGGHDGNAWLDDMHILDIRRIRTMLQPSLTVEVPSSSLLDDMLCLVEPGMGEDTHADVTFVVEGVPVRLHRAILSARSEYFKSMFASGMSESSAATIELYDVSHEVFRAVVRFLYTDTLPPSGEALVLPLLKEAQKMNLERLSRVCQRMLEARLDKTNAAALLEHADRHGAVPLRHACLRYMLSHFSSVSTTDGFLQLREDLLREVLTRRAGKSFEAASPLAIDDAVRSGMSALSASTGASARGGDVGEAFSLVGGGGGSLMPLPGGANGGAGAGAGGGPATISRPPLFVKPVDPPPPGVGPLLPTASSQATDTSASDDGVGSETPGQRRSLRKRRRRQSMQGGSGASSAGAEASVGRGSSSADGGGAGAGAGSGSVAAVPQRAAGAGGASGAPRSAPSAAAGAAPDSSRDDGALTRRAKRRARSVRASSSGQSTDAVRKTGDASDYEPDAVDDADEDDDEPGANVATTSEDAPAVLETWKCMKCTFTNDAAKSHCHLCREPYGTARQAALDGANTAAGSEGSSSRAGGGGDSTPTSKPKGAE